MDFKRLQEYVFDGDNVTCLQHLVDTGKLDVDYNDQVYGTLLCAAASRLCVRTVRLLLKIDADVNAADQQGNTPLHCVLHAMHSLLRAESYYQRAGDCIVTTLLYKNPDLNKMNSEGVTPLYMALRLGKGNLCPPFLADLLVKSVIYPDDADRMSCLIKDGIIHKEYDNGMLLRAAATFFSTDCALVLLDAGADVNCKNRDGCTPLHLAIARMKDSSYSGVTDHKAYVAAESMIELLLWYGADVTACDQSGWNSLHYAVSGTEFRIMQILWAYKAWSVLHVKTQRHESAMDMILDLKSNWTLERTRLGNPPDYGPGDYAKIDQIADKNDVKGSPAPDYHLTANDKFRKKGRAIELTFRVLQNAVQSQNKTMLHIKALEDNELPPDMISKIIRDLPGGAWASQLTNHRRRPPLETFKHMLLRDWIYSIGHEGGIVRKILDPKNELEPSTWEKPITWEDDRDDEPW